MVLITTLLFLNSLKTRWGWSVWWSIQRKWDPWKSFQINLEFNFTQATFYLKLASLERWFENYLKLNSFNVCFTERRQLFTSRWLLSRDPELSRFCQQSSVSWRNSSSRTNLSSQDGSSALILTDLPRINFYPRFTQLKNKIN